ncbi:transcription regulator protein [Herbaspirillum rubrisubalbicans M1]|uniref:LysR family transcriptional regulator n=1 Tax=Herbaspirillum rubrisubalbicans TaxID=80842 RepID=UPI00073A4485|nr:LysR family transcriptional regulator [Herbaspirillum rubrisubalbicans]ALU88895.1 transcription regulator protein [Herbaspirillum rubrisubalbicans M1]
MQRPLDLDAVQAFVLAAELQSFTRAAEALQSTQSAVSLKLKKLEERLGRRLLERTPRRVRLSSQGQQFLPVARELLAAHERALEQLEEGPLRFAVGISDHVAGASLPRALAQVHGVDPGVLVEVRVASSHDLMPLYEQGELDAVIVRREPRQRGGKLVMQERIGWFAHPEAQCWAGPALRVATFSSTCGIRELALRRLDEAGIDWIEVFIGGGILAVGAAVSAGLAVSALLHRSAPPAAVEVGERLGLPSLPLAQVMLHSRLKEPRTQAALRALVAALKAK